MGKRRNYSDDFKAGAVLMAQSEGWPDDQYAAGRVARHLAIPDRTLRRWLTGREGAPSDIVVERQKQGLTEFLEDEIRAAFAEMQKARDQASYRDLVVGVGIMVDKLQVLEGNPSERHDNTIHIVYEDMLPDADTND